MRKVYLAYRRNYTQVSELMYNSLIISDSLFGKSLDCFTSPEVLIKHN